MRLLHDAKKCYDGSFPPAHWHLPLRADVLAKNHHRVDDMQPPTLRLEPWRGLAITPKWKYQIHPITRALKIRSCLQFVHGEQCLFPDSYPTYGPSFSMKKILQSGCIKKNKKLILVPNQKKHINVATCGYS